MKFQLIQSSLNPLTTSTVELVLNNRGIKSENIEHYLNTTDEDINNPLLFGEERLAAAARALIKNIADNKNCLIVVDSDCDGYTSSALLINYLYDLFPAWVQNNLQYYIHDGKQHGLSDCVNGVLENIAEEVPKYGLLLVSNEINKIQKVKVKAKIKKTVN